MDPHQTIVAAALAAKSSAEMPKKSRSAVPPEIMPAPMAREVPRVAFVGKDVTPVILASLQY